MAIRTKNPKKAKEDAIKSITDDIKNSSSIIITEYRGMTVTQMTELRQKLRENECKLKVLRNNFSRIACEKLGISEIKDYFVGPVAVAFVSGEVNEAAKTIFDYIETAPTLLVKCALVDGEFFDAEKIEAYSKLPGRKQLISMFMSTLNATTSKFVRTLQAIVDKDEQKAE